MRNYALMTLCVLRERMSEVIFLPFQKLFQMHQPSPTPLFLFRFPGCIPHNLSQQPSQTAELVCIQLGDMYCRDSEVFKKRIKVYLFQYRLAFEAHIYGHLLDQQHEYSLVPESR